MPSREVLVSFLRPCRLLRRRVRRCDAWTIAMAPFPGMLTRASLRQDYSAARNRNGHVTIAASAAIRGIPIGGPLNRAMQRERAPDERPMALLVTRRIAHGSVRARGTNVGVTSGTAQLVSSSTCDVPR